MTLITYRTTFALDESTMIALKKLASKWQVSQAEVVRRAVAQAEAQAESDRPNPLELLQALHARGEGLPLKQANAYLAEVRADRKKWRGE
jgi:hypothetical protein